MANLVPLRIPNGWAVWDNKFYDVEPLTEDKDGFITNWYEGFLEDVLWITECKLLSDGGLGIPKFDLFNINISWKPDSSIDGYYYAKLDWDSELERFEIDAFSSKNRIEIKNKIEFWMNDIKENYLKYQTKISNFTT